VKRPPSRLAAVRLVAMDVDGVLTDGGIWYSDQGDELKRFDVRDGQGLVLLRDAGVVTAIVTRRHSKIVERRARELGIAEVHQDAADKAAVVQDLLKRHGIRAADACYVGDDLGDLPAMALVGVPVAVADAVPAVRTAAAYVTRAHGGRGAIRELCDLILSAKKNSSKKKSAR
jgi:3-deoxy-D-manno-octulosonate 8-phosphate phosphatase (KDO 8-P phosphatase)